MSLFIYTVYISCFEGKLMKLHLIRWISSMCVCARYFILTCICVLLAHRSTSSKTFILIFHSLFIISVTAITSTHPQHNVLRLDRNLPF